MACLRHVVLVLAFSASAALAQAQGDALARARQLYNAGSFAEAIAAADEARKTPALHHSASVVMARALLERHRITPLPEDLDRARTLLRDVEPGKLSPRDHVEHVIALGITVFLEGEAQRLTDRYGAAAVFFERAMARADAIDPPARERFDAAARDQLFEWWATALDRQAQFGPDTRREATYQRIVDRASDEMANNESAPSAMYWHVKASSGAGDYERAWSAAVANWISAAHLGERGRTLRTDLDRLVLDVVLRERARALTPTGDPRPVFEALVNQWEELKKKWEGGL